MKPPSRPPSNRDANRAGPRNAQPGGSKLPYRPGGPRPATPRAADDRPARRDQPRDAAVPVPVRQPRVPERPVLTAVARPARVNEDAPRPPERAAGKRPDASFGRQARPAVQRHDIDAPRGTIWLYGIHAIGAALQNPHRRLRRLLLTPEAETALSEAAPKPWPIPSETTDRARLDLLLGRDVVHQGAALLADPLGSPSLVQALERPGPVIVLDQVSDPRNVGAILRSAAVFGAACVITQDRNAPDESGALAKAASGALERVPLLRAVNIARTLVALRAAGCWVVGLDAAGAALSGPALAERRVALVLGSEGEGMRRLTRETCDELAGIPMAGGEGSAIDSLNVSAAGTVALYELSRRS